jgi:hypothetical protein
MGIVTFSKRLQYTLAPLRGSDLSFSSETYQPWLCGWDAVFYPSLSWSERFLQRERDEIGRPPMHDLMIQRRNRTVFTSRVNHFVFNHTKLIKQVGILSHFACCSW